MGNTRRRVFIGSSVTLSIIFVYFFTFVSLTWASKQVNDPFSCPSPNDKPNITIISDGKEYPMNYLNVTWPSFKELKLQCKAPYPIEWDFAGNRQTDVRFYAEVKVDNPLHITKRCYTVTMTTHGYGMEETRTGNYTCRALRDRNQMSSLYKYIQDRSDGIFSAVKHLNVTVNTDKNARTFIPCASNVANLTATLMNVDENGNITTLRSDIWRTYYPRYGFSIASNNTLVGKYICSATHENVSDVVEAIVALTPDVVAIPNVKYVSFHHDNSLFLSCQANEPVEIKFVNPVPGVMIYNNQEYPVGVNSHKYGASADFTKNNNIAKGQIACTGKKTRTNLFIWNFDTSYACNCTWTADSGMRYREFEGLILHDRSVRSVAKNKVRIKDRDLLYPDEIRGQIICNSPATPNVNISLLACTNPTECRIQSTCHRYGNCPLANEYSYKDDSLEEDEVSVGTKVSLRLRSGIMQCSAGEYKDTKMSIANLDALFFDVVPTEDLLRIIAPETHSFPGDTLIFACHGAAFTINRQLRWAFRYKNGSIAFIDIDVKDDKTGYDIQKIYRTSYIKIYSKDITAIMCFAPSWNSTVWKNVSVPLEVSDARPVETNTPESCEVSQSPLILLQRNSTVSPKRVRATHIVSNTTMVVYEPIDRLKLICRASYPVEWVYDGIKQNSTKINKVSCSSGNNTKKVYEAVVFINRSLKESTGNYTCRKTLQNNPLAWVYLYIVDDTETSFVNEGRHVEIVKSNDDSDPWITIPCRVSNPESKPKLFLDVENSETPQRLELGDKLKYNPTAGFILDVSLMPEPVSTFFCSMDENATDFGMLVTVHKKPGSLLYGEAQVSHSNIPFIIVTVFMVLLVIGLTAGLVFMYRKLQQGVSRNTAVENGHKMETTDVFAAYDDDVSVRNQDTENIVDVDGYHRF